MEITKVSSPASTASSAPGVRIRLIRWLVLVNLGLVALQAISAGFLMSENGPAIILHRRGAIALELGALLQVVAAGVLWWRGRVLAWIVRSGIVLFVIVVLQFGLGRTKRYWLHVPIGVGLFGGLVRQTRHLLRPEW
ncbi:MAG TPA: hypothetical protein VKE51_14945 [Vicinamibacterales bacterium]|nr:hypothetical protein [Vicinamibacterales bacterium]